ncbi:hypothetical protein JNW87_35900, partial [Micromonospora sp. ATA51]|nr:hypothetical protein [Micromonospora sp. ATA51]
MPFEVRIDDRNVSFDARSLDLTDPVARPLARLRAGRPPAEPTEIAVSQRALRRLGVPLGGTVRTADGGGPYRVVGVVEFPDNLREVVAVRPEAPAGPVAPADESWLVDVPGRLDPALVDRLNARGVTVTARTAVPGRDDAAGDGTPLPDAADTGNAVLVGGLGLLEVVLLVGPAFAVGVRRRRRDLALVAVAGGDRRAPAPGGAGRRSGARRRRGGARAAARHRRGVRRPAAGRAVRHRGPVRRIPRLPGRAGRDRRGRG